MTLKEKINLARAKELLREGMKPAEIEAKYEGFKKMQLAGYLAAMNRGKKNYQTPTPQQVMETPVEDSRPNSGEIDEANAKILLSKGCSPEKLAYYTKGKITEGTLRSWKAHVSMDTYKKNPALLSNGHNKKNGRIKKKEQLVPFLRENVAAKDLSFLALALGNDGAEIENTLVELYHGKFGSREELHNLLIESKEEIGKLLEEGLTSLGAFIGTYSLFERRMAPIILGPAIASIPIEKATPTLEKMLLRVANGIYDPIFNKSPQETIKDLTAKTETSTGLSQKVYASLVSQYRGALKVGEYIKNFASRKDNSAGLESAVA